MKAIQTITPGRLTDSNNINSTLITDLTQNVGDKIAVKITFTDSTQYLLVVDAQFFSYAGIVESRVQHYVRFSENELWNSLDVSLIDKTVFPSINSLVTSNRLVINTTTGVLYDTTDSGVDKTVFTNENGTLKSGFSYYYDYLRYSPLGKGIENALIADITKRLLPFQVQP